MDPHGKSETDFRKVLISGIIQIVLSVVNAVLGIVAVVDHAHLGYTGAGIWTAVFFLASGIFGVTSWKYKTETQLKIFMWLSGVAILFALVLLGITGSAMSMDAHDDDFCNSAYWKWCANSEAIEVPVVVAGLLELLTALASFIYCCRKVGCCASTRPSSPSVNPAVAHYVTQNHGNQLGPGQVVFMTSPSGTIAVDEQGRPVQHNGLPLVFMQSVNHARGFSQPSQQATVTPMDQVNVANPPPYSPPTEGAVGGVETFPTKDVKLDLSQT